MQKTGESEEKVDPSLQKKLDLIRAYKSFFGQEDAQTVLYDLMQKSYFLSPVSRESNLAAAREEGMRELMLYILEMMDKKPEDTMKFINQQSESEEKYYD